jgi:hypothetical protein
LEVLEVLKAQLGADIESSFHHPCSRIYSSSLKRLQTSAQFSFTVEYVKLE